MTDPTGRVTVLFSGNVQGVGFRYTARHLARGFEVTGYVRNLTDGRVELVAEGETAEVDRFVQDIQQEMGGYISKTRIVRESASGEFAGFSVRY